MYYHVTFLVVGCVWTWVLYRLPAFSAAAGALRIATLHSRGQTCSNILRRTWRASRANGLIFTRAFTSLCTDRFKCEKNLPLRVSSCTDPAGRVLGLDLALLFSWAQRMRYARAWEKASSPLLPLRQRGGSSINLRSHFGHVTGRYSCSSSFCSRTGAETPGREVYPSKFTVLRCPGWPTISGGWLCPLFARSNWNHCSSPVVGAGAWRQNSTRAQHGLSTRLSRGWLGEGDTKAGTVRADWTGWAAPGAAASRLERPRCGRICWATNLDLIWTPPRTAT
jgi:hypothetical protein